MTARRLRITPEVWLMMFSRPDGWRVIKNRLPEDAKLARVLFDHMPVEVECNASVPPGVEPRWDVSLWITSEVFRDTDPIDLPPIQFEAIELPKTEHIQFTEDKLMLRIRGNEIVYLRSEDGPPEPEEPKPITFREFT